MKECDSQSYLPLVLNSPGIHFASQGGILCMTLYILTVVCVLCVRVHVCICMCVCVVVQELISMTIGGLVHLLDWVKT